MAAQRTYASAEVRGALSLLGSLAILLGERPALAAEPSEHAAVRLEYKVGPGVHCPAEKVLHDEVARQLGYSPFLSTAAGRVTVTVDRRGSEIVGQVEVTGVRPWSRAATYPAGACLALFSWMGNVIGFHLERGDVAPGGRPPPRLPEEPPPVTPPEPPKGSPSSELTTPPALSKPEEPPSSRHLVLALGPALTLGVSGPGFAVLGYAGWRWSFFSLGGELRYDAPTSALLEGSTSSAHLHAQAVGGALVPCGHLRGAFACALLSAGVVLGDASGIGFPQPVKYPYLGGGLRAGFEQAFTSWLGVRLHLDGLVMFQTTVTLLEGAPVQAPSPLSSRVNGVTGLDLMTYF